MKVITKLHTNEEKTRKPDGERVFEKVETKLSMDTVSGLPEAISDINDAMAETPYSFEVREGGIQSDGPINAPSTQIGSGGIQSDGPIVGSDGFVHSNGYTDTRSVNNTPEWYQTNKKRQIVREFKLKSTIGLSSAVGNYIDLSTHVFYSDPTGGTVKQVAIDNDGNVYTRTGAGSSTSWRAWTKLSLDGHTHSASAITSGTIADARLPAKAKPADYVIEIGSNYTKWNSGKLEMYGQTDPFDANGTHVDYYITPPVPFVETAYLNAMTRTLNQAASRLTINRIIPSGSDIRLTVTTDGALTGIQVYWEFKGRWK